MSGFVDLILVHKGKRICVMGGGPGLAEHLEQVRADLYISTNAHGVDIAPRVDYVLAMDEIHGVHGVPMGPWLRERTAAPIISPHGYADYVLGEWPQAPRFVLSGMVAAWCAYMMGAKVVILAGCDGYVTERPGRHDGYRTEAAKMARDIHTQVRVAGGGPLTETWPRYAPGESFRGFKPSTAIEGWMGRDGRIQIEVVKPTHIHGVDRPKGWRGAVLRHEVKAQLKHKMVREV